MNLGLWTGIRLHPATAPCDEPGLFRCELRRDVHEVPDGQESEEGIP